MVAFSASASSASPLDPTGSDWEGLAELVAIARAELGAEHVVTAAQLDFARLSPGDGIVMLHPERHLDTEELSAFLHGGGRVVLLDDYGRGDELLEEFGIRRVPLPDRPTTMLRSNPAFAVAEAAGSHPAVRDVGEVVTNHATGLADTRLAPLLVVRGAPHDVLLGVAGVVGKGRLLALGDSSLVMNSMLRYPGNRALAHALVRYAARADPVEGEARSGPGTLYVVANDFASIGRYAGDAGRTGPAAEARRAALRALEAVRRGAPPLAAYVASVLVGVGVVFWAATRAGRVHRPIAPKFVRPTPLEAQGGVAGHAAALRARGGSRGLVLAELVTALEEHLATRLGLERVAAPAELVERVRAAGWLEERDLRTLAGLLGRLSANRGATASAARAAPARPLEHVSEAEVLRVAATVRALVAAADAARAGPTPSPGAA